MKSNKAQIFTLKGVDPKSLDTASATSKIGDGGFYAYFDGSNDFPVRLNNIAQLSPTHGSILHKKSVLCKGSSLRVIADDPTQQGIVDALAANMGGMGLHEMLGRHAYDYFTYGGFATRLYGSYNPDTQLSTMAGWQHVDWLMLRKGWIEGKTDDGEHQKTEGFWLRADWNPKNEKDCPPEFYLGYQKGADMSKQYIGWHSRYTSGKQYYPLPDYYAAFKSAETEVELINFKAQNTVNSFNPGGILMLGGGLDPEQEKALKQELSTEFTGTNNAGKILVMANLGPDGATWTPLNSHPAEKDVTVYSKGSIEELAMAHQLPSLTLLGLPGGPSLSGDASTIEQGYRLFMQTCIKPARAWILNVYKGYFADMGYPVSFEADEVVPEEGAAQTKTDEGTSNGGNSSNVDTN